MTDLYFTITREIIDNREMAVLAFIGGILPAILWLWFWLKEDKKKPEPKIRIALTFIGGMLIGPIVISLQFFLETIILSTILIVVFSAFFEEFFKYIAAYLTALRTKVSEEPMDTIIYLITAALGFSALENFLYLLAPLFEGSFIDSFVLANFRFVGASLLHVAASGIIGIFLAFSFYKPTVYRRISLVMGLILATGLHVFYNLLIMKEELIAILSILALVWVIIAVILLFFEKVKTFPIKN